jgi:hypothetical protein
VNSVKEINPYCLYILLFYELLTSHRHIPSFMFKSELFCFAAIIRSFQNFYHWHKPLSHHRPVEAQGKGKSVSLERKILHGAGIFYNLTSRGSGLKLGGYHMIYISQWLKFGSCKLFSMYVTLGNEGSSGFCCYDEVLILSQILSVFGLYRHLLISTENVRS